jgi:hypothetical protein
LTSSGSKASPCKAPEVAPASTIHLCAISIRAARAPWLSRVAGEPQTLCGRGPVFKRAVPRHARQCLSAVVRTSTQAQALTAVSRLISSMGKSRIKI